MKAIRALRRAGCVLLAALFLSTSAFAIDWDIAKGSITVSADKNGQTVTQNGVTVRDDNPTITGETTTNTITVVTEDGRVAQITISGLMTELDEDADSSVIEIGSADVIITVDGENILKSDSYDDAVIHVTDGSLTLTSRTGGSLTTDGNNIGAEIGSSEDEDFNGSIIIEGDLTLVAGSASSTSDGAAIGSGEGGDFNGSVTIRGDADVTAISEDEGAGIGSGEDGDFNGSIDIGGNAKVTARSDDDGAGIGAGQYGDFNGTVTIGGNADVTAVSDDTGAGIGSGRMGDFTGSVSIGENAKVSAIGGTDEDETEDNEGAGIGSGAYGNFTGTVTINGNADVTARSGDGAAIGSGESESPEYADEDYPASRFDGVIIIAGNARVNAETDCCGAGIGSGRSSEFGKNGKIYILGNANVRAGNNDGDSAAIGSGFSDGADFNGTIIFGPNVRTELFGYTKAGAGCYGESNGTVTTVTEDEERDILHELFPPEMRQREKKEVELYWVESETGRRLDFTSARGGVVLTVTTPEENAELMTSVGRLKKLAEQGVAELKFASAGYESSVTLESLIALGETYQEVSILHLGETAFVSVGGRIVE